MLPVGRYKTAAGSTMTISGKHGGLNAVVFDWFEENACFECAVKPHDVDGDLVWVCEHCGGGRAKLVRVEGTC